MSQEREKLPLDAKILSEAIIELNISRRNVSIYPKGHPSVEQSLDRAYEKLQKLFDLRPEISFAIARDTIVVDDYYLEKTNPVYLEFARHMSDLGISSVSFITGLTKEELYSFHTLLTLKPEEITLEKLEEEIKNRNLIHIRVTPVDYDAFTFEDGKVRGDDRSLLWEKYVYGLVEGTLRTEDVGDSFQEIPPELLAGYLNRMEAEKINNETYDHVITTYMRRSSERAFSGSDLKKLMNFINSLKPELKRQFLSSGINTLSSQKRDLEKALKETPVDDIIDLLRIINEQKVAIPDALKNLLDKFSQLEDNGLGETRFKNQIISDDIFLSKSAINLLEGGQFSNYVTDRYQREIEKLLEFKGQQVAEREAEAIRKECLDEVLEREYSRVLQELLSLENVTQQEYMKFAEDIYNQAAQFLETGQYEDVLRIFHILEENLRIGRFPHITEGLIKRMHADDFLLFVTASFQITGRLNRKGAIKLTNYYGERLIPYLMDALFEEESSAVRSFLITLLAQFGDSIIPLALKHLGNSAWYIKRNMIHLLSLTGNPEVIPHIRFYCHHENRKVGIEAIRALLKLGDGYGVNMVREMLQSENKEDIEQAATLCAIHRLRDLVPDLINILRRKPITKGDFLMKIPVIRALGEMKAVEAVPIFRGLLTTKSVLFKGPLEEMKLEIYKTMKNYPPTEVTDILEAGLNSKNELIRQEAETIVQKIMSGR